MHLVCSHHKPANRTSSRPAHLTPDASEERKKKLSVSTSTCLPSELTCFRVKVVCFDRGFAMKSNDSTPGPQDSQSKPHSFLFPPQSASCAKQHQWWRPASIDRVAVPRPGVSGLCRMFAIRPLGHRDLTAICMAGVTAPMNDLVMCLCLKKKCAWVRNVPGWWRSVNLGVTEKIWIRSALSCVILIYLVQICIFLETVIGPRELNLRFYVFDSH